MIVPRRVPGHPVTIFGHGTGWRAECFCGWQSAPANTGTRAVNRALHHLECADGSADRAMRAQLREQAADHARLLLNESLAQSDRHITRCGVDGSQVWDGDCGTCNTLTRRLGMVAA